MEKISEKLKKIEFYKKTSFWIFAFITILFFGCLSKMEYATDTYCVFTSGDVEAVRVFMRAGRFLTAIMLKTFFTLKFSENLIYLISFIIAIFASITSMYRLYKIINKDIQNNTISIIASILIILNAFIIELMLFIEKGIMVLSILFNVLAFEQLLKVFDGNKKSIMGVLIYMTLANCSYQGTVALFIVLSMPYILKKSKSIKDFIIKNIITALSYGIPAGIIYISTRFIFPSERVTGNINLKQSILKIIKNIINIFVSTWQIMPKLIFSGFIVMIIVIIIYKAFKQKRNTSEFIISICGIIYIIAGTVLTCIMPQLLQDTESIWMVPRAMYALASLIGVMLVLLYTNFKVSKKLETLLVLVSILYISIQYINFQNIIIDRYTVNSQDKAIAISIKNKIEEYEKDTGNKVNNVVFYHDKEVIYTYQGVLAIGDMNVKAFFSDWASKAAIEYYTERKFEIGETNFKIQDEFEQTNWNVYDTEQIIIEGDTIHICIF